MKLSRQDSSALKGVAMLLVMASHLLPYYYQTKGASLLGPIGVTLFLYVSYYGLTVTKKSFKQSFESVKQFIGNSTIIYVIFYLIASCLNESLEIRSIFIFNWYFGYYCIAYILFSIKYLLIEIIAIIVWILFSFHFESDLFVLGLNQVGLSLLLRYRLGERPWLLIIPIIFYLIGAKFLYSVFQPLILLGILGPLIRFSQHRALVTILTEIGQSSLYIFIIHILSLEFLGEEFLVLLLFPIILGILCSKASKYYDIYRL